MAFPNPDGKSYRPPMWSSQLFGEPHGEWMVPDVVTDPHTLQKTVWDNENVSNGRLVQIESAIKELVNMRKASPEQGWEHLFGLLRPGDSGDRRRNGRITVDMFRMIMQKTFRRQNFTITEEETQALYMKYGHDEYGRMPYEMFAHRVFSGQAHQLSLEGTLKRAFDAKNPKNWAWQGMIKYPICRSGVFAPSDWEDYSTQVCRRSACIGLQDNKPEAYLKLEHVYGYSSPKNVSPNLFYTEKSDVVYYTAAVGIVYDDDNNRQKFFLRHDDDIQCLAITPDRKTVATGQVGAEPRVFLWSSTTLRGPEGADDPIELNLPYGHRGVIVMGFSHDGNKLATVSTDDEHTVTIWDWRTSTAELNAATAQGIPPIVWGVVWNPFKGRAGAHPCDFITYGVKHIKFWTLGGEAGLEAGAGSFDVCEQQDVLCACFLPTNHVLVGGPNGNISVFEDGMGILKVDAHKPGSVDEDDPNHLLREGGCTTLVREEDGKVISGGGDGKIILWEIKTEPFQLVQAKQLFDSTMVDPDGPPRMFTGLDYDPIGKTVVAADSENDMWEVDDDPRVMVEGQSGDVTCVAPYPVEGKAHIYATACADGNINLWDGDRRENIRAMEIVRQRDSQPKGCKKGDILACRAVAFSAQGDQMAVTTCGVAGPTGWTHPDGGGVIQIFDAPGNGEDLMFKDDALQDEKYDHYKAINPETGKPCFRVEWKDNEEAIDDVKFSPDGRYVATGSHDNWIDIYLIEDPDEQKWHRTGRCQGHSSFISHLDWDTESECIVANDAAYEVLFWRVDGRQQVVNQRDTKWATWTCTLGFWVMGMWQDGMCGNDINSVCRSNDAAGRGEEFLAAADDNGKVWLFNFPCVIEDAPGHAHKGHASHVAGVTFTNDDRRVLSVGGHDRSLFQWKTHGVQKPSRHFKKEGVPRKKKSGGGVSGGGVDDRSRKLKLELQVRELQHTLKKQNALMEEKNREIQKLNFHLEND